MGELTEVTKRLGRIERVGDTVAAVFDRHYDTSPEDLWEACTQPERLARWFAPVSGELRRGGRFTIHFDDGDTPACRVVTCEAPARLVWEWPLGERVSLVTVEVRADGDGSRLVLRHGGLTATQGAGYAAGWDAHLRSLEARLGNTPAPDWDATWTALHELYAAR
jgi:uncharacterized protein YndB with AHSA1/START domain